MEIDFQQGIHGNTSQIIIICVHTYLLSRWFHSRRHAPRTLQVCSCKICGVESVRPIPRTQSVSIYRFLSSGLHFSLSRRYGHLCRHEFIRPDCLFRLKGTRHFMIIIFSIRQRSHFFLPEFPICTC